jgi:hypothetical protein
MEASKEPYSMTNEIIVYYWETKVGQSRILSWWSSNHLIHIYKYGNDMDVWFIMALEKGWWFFFLLMSIQTVHIILIKKLSWNVHPNRPILYWVMKIWKIKCSIWWSHNIIQDSMNSILK